MINNNKILIQKLKNSIKEIMEYCRENKTTPCSYLEGQIDAYYNILIYFEHPKFWDSIDSFWCLDRSFDEEGNLIPVE